MACKLKCPKCSKVLKEEGDAMKRAQGEYRVFDSLWNPKSEAGKYRLIECLSCYHFGGPMDFDPCFWIKVSREALKRARGKKATAV